MKRFFGVFKISLVLCVLLSLFSFSASAKEDIYVRLSDNKGGIISMSHRGDTVSFPENSLEAVLSAADKGADMISVSVRKSSDGVLVLCEKGDLTSFCKIGSATAEDNTYEVLKSALLYETDGSVSESTIVSLKETVRRLRGKSVLVLDNAWEYRNEIDKFCKENDAYERVMLRTEEKAKNIKEWKEETGSALSVIGVRDGGVIFTSVSHIETLKDEVLVQYQSKNYFNEMFKGFVTKRFSAEGYPRAIAPMYNADLCGQRTDSDTGWNEMINRGFSVIETNCIEELENYISRTEEVKTKLGALLKKAENVNILLYSTGSEKNFSKAFAGAKEIYADNNASLESLQQGYSLLSETMKNLTFGTHEDDQKGSLNITAGKVIAAVVFGSLILAGEIYVYKKQKRKNK